MSELALRSAQFLLSGMLIGISGVTGTGVNTVTESIIVYLDGSNPSAIDEIHNRVGVQVQGYNIVFSHVGKVRQF